MHSKFFVADLLTFFLTSGDQSKLFFKEASSGQAYYLATTTINSFSLILENRPKAYKSTFYHSSIWFFRYKNWLLLHVYMFYPSVFITSDLSLVNDLTIDQMCDFDVLRLDLDKFDKKNIGALFTSLFANFF